MTWSAFLDQRFKWHGQKTEKKHAFKKPRMNIMYTLFLYMSTVCDHKVVIQYLIWPCEIYTLYHTALN